MSPEQAIVDTSVYVSLLRQGRFEKELLGLPLLVRFSSVVVAELLRGARSRRAFGIVHDLHAGRSLINPTPAMWIESGEVTATLGQTNRYDSNELRELQFDVLIALSARSIGAYLVTCDADDFRVVKAIRDFKLIVWS
jgi:predicted nucleic acid-binding protein